MLVLLFVGIGAADRGYFPCHEHGGLCSAARYRGLSVGAFVSAASRGEPFVVEDAARGMPLANISCAEMGTRFAGGFMRREYDPNGGEGDYVLPIADAGQWARQPVRGQRQDFELDPEAPTMGPLYWGIKDAAIPAHLQHETGGSPGERALLRRVGDLTRVPYFMPADNLERMRSSPEFWMGPPGSGAKAHVDMHCHSTVALQLSGTRRWRVGVPPPSVKRSVGEQLNDGRPYDKSNSAMGGRAWQPDYVLTLRAGEALVFPPGFIHETKNVGDSCAVSLTYQFQHPLPAGYWRAFWPRMRRLGDLANCWAEVAALATLGYVFGDATTRPLPQCGCGEGDSGDAAATMVVARRIDVDGDGELSSAEVGQALHGANAASEVGVADAVRFHDTDGDGVLRLAEFAAGFGEWCAVERMVRSEPIIDAGQRGELGGEQEELDGRGGEEEEEEEVRDEF